MIRKAPLEAQVLGLQAPEGAAQQVAQVEDIGAQGRYCCVAGLAVPGVVRQLVEMMALGFEQVLERRFQPRFGGRRILEAREEIQ